MTPILAILIVALAGHRLARALTIDDISVPFRAWVLEHAYPPRLRNPWPEGARTREDAMLAGWKPDPTPALRNRPWGWAYGLVSCPHCAGFHISVLLWIGWANWDDARAVITAIAVAGAQSILSARGMQ